MVNVNNGGNDEGQRQKLGLFPLPSENPDNGPQAPSDASEPLGGPEGAMDASNGLQGDSDVLQSSLRIERMLAELINEIKLLRRGF